MAKVKVRRVLEECENGNAQNLNESEEEVDGRVKNDITFCSRE